MGSIAANERQAGQWGKRFESIDALRGLAALVVAYSHTSGSSWGIPAVIVFFVISGYCISASVHSAALHGLGLLQYMRRRVRRIYPPYLASVGLWYLVEGHGDRRTHSVTAWLMNLTLTQWVGMVRHPISAAWGNRALFDGPAWSLCYEEQFYLVMGLLLLLSSGRFTRFRRLFWGLLALAMGWNALYPTTSFGFFLDEWVLFAVGCFVFYWLCLAPAAMRRWLDFGLAASLAGCLALLRFKTTPWKAPPDTPAGVHLIYDELRLALEWGLILIVVRRFDGAFQRWSGGRLLRQLGLISYSLYLTHTSAIHLFNEHLQELIPVLMPGWYTVLVSLLFQLGVAAGFWWCFERPFLNRSLPEPVAVPASA